MKLLLEQAARINCNAGEIVEVSSAQQAAFLLATGAAVPVMAEKDEQEQKTVKTKKGK